MPSKLSAPSASAGSVNIAVRLREQILEGHYAYGERLPPERQLATYLDASRSTVREALRQLEESKLVTRRMGSGTFVTYRRLTDADEVAEATSPIELIDVRLAVEPQIARLAVLNASAKDLGRLAETFERVDAASDAESFARADEEFHLTLADCTRNQLMIWLYRNINEVRGHSLWKARKKKILTKARIEEYNRQHRAVYEAVIHRDTEGAIAAVIEHLEKARADLLGAG